MDNVNGQRVIIRKQDRIDYIISGLCEYWGVTPQELFAYARKPEKTNRKRIAMQILYDIADCSLKDISFAIGYKNASLTCIHLHINTLRDDISADTHGNKELKSEYDRVLKHLNL